jgi:YD repeat-containing protein
MKSGILVCAGLGLSVLVTPASAQTTTYYDSQGNRTGQSTTTESSTYWGFGETVDTSTTTYIGADAEPHGRRDTPVYSKRR